ncbi:branchpoint-bridging protein-like [Chenopodium quinoa]|uniref:branchpoint-bridging protein-like n=1 Tax=Chenopodium quinoa TaxID=63459 RepID=UPI000B76BA86|nr:branchpoint-bridging protein-like [Chenopodium quinoa]
MLKVQPGRPKAKKRKLEPGEGTSAAPEGKKPKVKKQCKNCGGFGHFAKTCKAEAAPEQPNPPATNPKGGRPQMQTPWLKEQRKKSEEKAARQAALKLPQYQPPTTAQVGSSNAAPATAVSSQPTTRTEPLPTQPVTRSNRSLSQPTRVPTTTPPKVKIQTRSKLHVMTSKKDKDLN